MLGRTGKRLMFLSFPVLTPVVGPKVDIPSPEQLVAVRIPLSPFQAPDRCDTMCCLVLTRPMRRREFIASMGGSAVSRAVRAQQSPQEYALM
jgi:hypothetical protein